MFYFVQANVVLPFHFCLCLVALIQDSCVKTRKGTQLLPLRNTASSLLSLDIEPTWIIWEVALEMPCGFCVTIWTNGLKFYKRLRSHGCRKGYSNHTGSSRYLLLRASCSERDVSFRSTRVNSLINTMFLCRVSSQNSVSMTLCTLEITKHL